ncbi:MAG TPA: glycosyltransferase [Terriglobales bacterium]|nr:glycosyltransferase [Terriglobales bacterium]
MPTLGLAMIVKDGANRLRDCLASAAGLASQVVIADTGSTDGTPELARALGAQVFDLPWQDDFSAARNAAIERLTTDWVLVMDDDEELDPAAEEEIPPLLRHAQVGGFFLTQRNYLPVSLGSGGHATSVRPNDSTFPRAPQAQGYADFPSCRLFRRHPQIRYSGRVHEQVIPQIRALGFALAGAGSIVHHFGHLSSPAQLRAKDELYRKLGRLKLNDAPNDPQAWIELGLQEYEQFKNYAAGIECFRKALALDPHGSAVPYLSLANLYVEIQAEELALDLLANVSMLGQSAGVKEHIRGNALYNLGRLKEARSAYLRALRILPRDVRIATKLGLTEIRLGRRQAASGLKKSGLARITRSLQESPEMLEVHDRMIKGYLLMNMLPQAAQAAERLARELPTPATILRAASIRARLQDWKAAEDFVLRGREKFPDSPELFRASAELAARQPQV